MHSASGVMTPDLALLPPSPYCADSPQPQGHDLQQQPEEEEEQQQQPEEEEEQQQQPEEEELQQQPEEEEEQQQQQQPEEEEEEEEQQQQPEEEEDVRPQVARAILGLAECGGSDDNYAEDHSTTTPSRDSDSNDDDDDEPTRRRRVRTNGEQLVKVERDPGEAAADRRSVRRRSRSPKTDRRPEWENNLTPLLTLPSSTADINIMIKRIPSSRTSRCVFGFGTDFNSPDDLAAFVNELASKRSSAFLHLRVKYLSFFLHEDGSTFLYINTSACQYNTTWLFTAKEVGAKQVILNLDKNPRNCFISSMRRLFPGLTNDLILLNGKFLQVLFGFLPWSAHLSARASL